MHSISEEQFYYDGPEGDLVYETESELGIVEAARQAVYGENLHASGRPLE